MKGAVADAGRDGGGNLARKVLDVLIRRISPLLVLLPQDASETVERCMEVVAEVERLEVSCIPFLDAKAVLQEIAVCAASVIFKAGDGA